MVVGGSRLPLLQTLSAADDRVESIILSEGNLGSDGLIGLIENVSSFRMANDDPVDFKVLELVCADLACKRSLALWAHVLWGDLNIFIYQGLNQRYVHADRSNHNSDVVGIELGLVEHVVYQILNLLDRAIAFPVSSDDWLSFLLLVHNIYILWN